MFLHNSFLTVIKYVMAPDEIFSGIKVGFGSGSTTLKKITKQQSYSIEAV